MDALHVLPSAPDTLEYKVSPPVQVGADSQEGMAVSPFEFNSVPSPLHWASMPVEALTM
jgi:hypothetical protein